MCTDISNLSVVPVKINVHDITLTISKWMKSLVRIIIVSCFMVRPEGRGLVVVLQSVPTIQSTRKCVRIDQLMHDFTIANICFTAPLKLHVW